MCVANQLIIAAATEKVEFSNLKLPDLTFMNLTFIWNFLTCSVTGAVDGAGHAYPSGSPDVTSGFFVEVHTVTCASVFCVVSFMCIFRTDRGKNVQNGKIYLCSI
jgi:hypothetical protein